MRVNLYYTQAIIKFHLMPTLFSLSSPHRTFHHQSSMLKMAEAATAVDKMAALATAANEARGLAMDSIAAAHSGHMGLPLGCAEIGATLYGSQVSYFHLQCR